MTYRNAQAKNIGNDEGDVYKFFQMKLSNLVQKNGGNHSFNWKTFECSDAVAPHSLGHQIILTSRNVKNLSSQHLLESELNSTKLLP